ncbi:hypothetical protein DAPPUDRAFT_243533 [Daphnia pulex]|uniref:Uncharacterized protein n=1 Tax=Daphnia pulex TaxID=6669 RepID=E9GJ17_DAPPU|nr:hypothetical protein DAPPUDRAFT_243533 [Daphnia pulex]|eukprot:EFX80366.1 hypothetical protein DAPPUDRAFT_243533 [Daphnia pulex]
MPCQRTKPNGYAWQKWNLYSRRSLLQHAPSQIQLSILSFQFQITGYNELKSSHLTYRIETIIKAESVSIGFACSVAMVKNGIPID